MADLSFSQGSDPVSIFNDATGDQLAVNSDGSINDNLAKVGGTAIALGQTTMAASVPVVIASNQTTISVNTEGTKTTYSAAFIALVPAATPTDILTITGSATKTIRVTRIALNISTTAGSGIALNGNLVTRSAANTGGTSTTAVNVPHDSANAAGTATVRGYTVNPTVLGTAVGPIRAQRFSATTAGTNQDDMLWEFGNRPAQCIVLRGTSQMLALNLSSTTVTGGVADCSIEWTEE